MSQKETVGTSDMKPPPTTVMQPRPSAALPRTPWMSHVLRGQPMLRPVYHMIHVPSPMAIVNTQPMFMQPPPNMQHHSGDGAAGGCIVSGCKGRAILPESRACEDNSEAIKTTASCSASEPVTHDVAFLKFQKNAQVHGIKISSTKEKLEPVAHDVAFLEFQKNAQVHGIKISSTEEKLEHSGSPVSGRLSVESPEFTPHGVIPGPGMTFALPESHRPDVIVVSSDDDEDEINLEDTINHSKDDENLELQTMEVLPLTVDGADNCADYSESFLSSELQFASDMQLNTTVRDVFCIGGALCSNHREMVSTCTQTEFTIVENVDLQMIDKWTSTEDLKNTSDKETSTELTAAAAAAAAAVAASVTEADYPKQSHSMNEKSEVSVNVPECSCLKVPSLDTIDDSTSEEETDLSREGKFPETTVKSKTNSLASESLLLLIKDEHSDNTGPQLSDVSGKQEGPNIARISKANSLTSNISSSIVHEEQSDRLVREQNWIRGDLEGWERAEKYKTNGITSSTSSIVIRKEYPDSIYHQPSDFRDECRRRNVAAVEAVCEMFETDKVASNTDRATDSVTKVDNYLSTLTELNIKNPEVGQSRGPEDYSRRLETVPVSALFEDQVLDRSASSTTQLTKLRDSEETNDLSNVLSRSGRSSVDNCSMGDNIRRQQKGPSSSHSNASSRQHKNSQTSSRNVCLDEAAAASLQDTVCTSKVASMKGRDNVSRSENGALQKAYNARLENLDVKGSSSSLLEDDCSRNAMTLADDESLSGSENMSVVMSVSGAELKSECSSMANSLSQIALIEPGTELMDMIKSQLLMCDPALANNPKMLETLAVQQLYLMHQEQMLASQMMEVAMRQHQQPQPLLLPQHAMQQVLTPQQLLLQQHLVAQQQLAQPHLLPPQQFVMLPPMSKPQKTLPPRFPARLPSQGRSCTQVPTNVHSSIPENSLASCTNNAAFRMGSFAEDSELQKRSSQDFGLNQSHVELGTIKNQESAVKAMDYKQQEKSLNSVTNSFLDIKDNSLTASAGNGLSAAAPASQGKRASSVSSKASAGFHPNGERSESAVTSPAMSSCSAARAQQPDSSASVARSGSGKPSGLSDFKVSDVCGDKKLFGNSIGIDTEFTPTLPVSSVTKPSYASASASEKIGLPVSETAESRASDHSFGTRGRGIGGGGGVRPKSVAKIDNIGNGASADGCPGSFRSQEKSQDFVKFSKGEYGKEKLPEFKRSTTKGSITQGSATDQSAMGGDCVKNRKGFVPDKPVVRNRWMEGPFRRTTTHMQESDEDWGEAGSAAWIKDPLHYGPPKCSTSRVRPKTEEW